jgi:3-deoxy-manno-octulosonate cytidylyltransferase (CMP-KDO synthetase)
MIGDKTMIERVCLQAQQSGAESITVATDHFEIKKVVEEVGFKAVMTAEDHPSGSDRIFEAATKLGLADHEVIVNVQGDEPFIPPSMISQVADLVSANSAKMATLCCPIETEQEVLDPNAVKVVFDTKQRSIYFSRSPLPYVRNSENKFEFSNQNHFRHLGIYAYTKQFLTDFISWPESRLEQLERLEQLRVLENGVDIFIDEVKQAPPAGIDTADDLANAVDLVSGSSSK